MDPDYFERLLDNAATGSQERRLLRDDQDEEGDLREVVRLNVCEPLASEIASRDQLLREALRLIDAALEGDRAEAIAFYEKHKHLLA